jgi:hypothetical protein
MGLKRGAIGNTAGEPIGNLREHVGNKGKMNKKFPAPIPIPKNLKENKNQCTLSACLAFLLDA